MAYAKQKIGGEIGEIRASIDIDKLNTYFAGHVHSINAPVNVKQFKFGQSNPTYFLVDATGVRFVLRKKPDGKLLSKTAHRIEREYAILHALHKHNITARPEQRVPIPEPVVLCEDASVIGTPFYVMEFLDGRIFTNVSMPEISSEDRRECWLAAVRALASLSALDPISLGLSNFGPSTPYFPRQIKSFARVSRAQAEAVDVETGKKTGEIPHFDELMGWYSTNFPDESKTSLQIVHGDYRLDNMVFHPTENRVIGILDWELCTLGNSLADLANLLMPWSIDPKDVPAGTETALRPYSYSSDPSVSLEELEREYCRLTSRPYPVVEMVFARSWMIFRLSIISQGIAARYALRQASSEKAIAHVKLFPLIGALARKALEREGVSILSQAANTKRQFKL